MIVRILHEGQFDIDGRDLDIINDLDNQLVAAVAAGNEQQFGTLFSTLLKTVREHGKPVPIDRFVESDIILPAADSSMEDVQHLFTGEGLVPG
jgi:hypothetical protein